MNGEKNLCSLSLLLFNPARALADFHHPNARIKSLSMLFQKSAKGLRELVIHQKIHAVVSTTWSVNREA